MLKTDAITELGGTVAAAARAIGITPQAVGQWPDELPPAIRDRVQAVMWRRQFESGAKPEPSELIGTEGAPPVPALATEASDAT